GPAAAAARPATPRSPARPGGVRWDRRWRARRRDAARLRSVEETRRARQGRPFRDRRRKWYAPSPMGEMLTRERDVAVAAAREAGEIVRHWYAKPITVTEKGPDHPLTQADLAANTCIRGHIAKAFPEDGWLSEETADSSERLARRRVWVVDPLD